MAANRRPVAQLTDSSDARSFCRSNTVHNEHRVIAIVAPGSATNTIQGDLVHASTDWQRRLIDAVVASPLIIPVTERRWFAVFQLD